MACNKYSLVQYKCCRPASDFCQFRARLGKPTIAMSDAAPNSQFCANRVAPRRLSRRVVYRAATIFAATNCTECVDPASAPRAEKTSSRLTDKVAGCHAHRHHNLAFCLAIFLIVSYLCLLPPATSLTLSTASSPDKKIYNIAHPNVYMRADEWLAKRIGRICAPTSRV